jgi:uncharacterized protein involved in type VI secretion and phage assembly
VANPTGTPTILLDGEELTSELFSSLVQVRVEQSIHVPSRAELQVVDPEYDLFDSGRFGLGKVLEVKLPTATNAVRSVFSGPVVEVGIDHDEERDDAPYVVVVAQDAGALLWHTRMFQAFLDHTPSEIVSAIAGRHGLSAEVALPSGADALDPYLLQASSDREALDQLAAACGCEWYAMAGTLHFRPRPRLEDGVRLSYGEDLFRFSAGFAGLGLPRDVTVRGWNMETQDTWVESWATRYDAAALGSNASFVSEQFDRAMSGLADSLPRHDVTVRDGAEAQRVAKATVAGLLGAAVTSRGLAFGNADLVAGGFVTINAVGDNLEGTYYLTEVTHEFGSGGQLLTRFATTPAPPAVPTAVSLAERSGPPITSDWAAGLVLGKVSNLNDPDGSGRVKVAFPALGPEVESEWARVVSVGAGDGHGFDNRPELNEEVVVGFERGDPRFPFVFGGLWSKNVPPPVADAVDGAAGVVAKRVITSPAGHAITISDGVDTSKGDADRYVSIVLSDGTELHVGEDGVRITTKDLPITFTSGKASITLTDDKVQIDAAELTVKTKQDTKIDAGGALTAKGKSGATIESGASAEFKGKMVKVESSGPAEIKGKMVKLN